MSKRLYIQSYIGYSDLSGTVIKGRVLRNPTIESSDNDTWWQNLVNTFKRFNSKEVPNINVTLSIGTDKYYSLTDKDGYYEFNVSHSLLNTKDTPYIYVNEAYKIVAPVIQIDADYIVISDIDDTIIKTQVSSVLKLKLLYNTIFKNQYQRSAVPGMADVYRHLAEDHEANFFYISKSPNNLYPYILSFLQYKEYPIGSIILRDFGWHLLSNKSSFGEKYEELQKLYNRFPNKKFILVGDGAEKDADIYADLTLKYPDQTKGIFIRSIGKASNIARIKKDIIDKNEVPILLFETSEQLKAQLWNIMHPQ